MIPEGWSEARLGDLFDVKSSKRVLQSDWRLSGVPFYRGREITELSKRGEVDNDLFIDRALFRELSSRFGVPARGDILVSAIGTIGNVFLVRGDHEFYFKDASVLWLSSRGVSESSFVVQWMRSPGFQTQLPTGNGTTVDTLTIGILGDLRVPLPPLDEQRAIAEALTYADALVESLAALIAKKRDMKQAAMQQLLTGRTRLGGLDEAWKKSRLGEVASFESGAYLPADRYLEGPVIVQGAGGQMGWTNSTNFSQPITVIGRVGTIGKPRFHDGDCWVNNNAAALVSKASVVAKFLHFVLQSLDFRRFTSTTAQPFLAVADLLSHVILVPPLAEQKAIATVLSDMDAEINVLVAQREKAELVKQGMMQELLSGRVRLA